MKEEPILNALKNRPGAFVSGEEMSRLVGVSRTAIWKEIEKLREEGYQILAQPHLGYRLMGIPDRLTPQELSWTLNTQRIGRRIHAYNLTDSTMNVAHRLAGAGEPDGTVVVAEGQFKGRGRLSRSWISPKGKGIYLSVILRPEVPLFQVPLVTLMAAVAVAKGIREATGLQPEIKWPNDLLLKMKKVAGILTELNGELNRVNYIVLGIGVNVNARRSDLPGQATSLSEELSHPVDRIRSARILLTELDRSYAKFLAGESESILQEWRRFASFLGRPIRVAVQGKTIDGQALDIDSRGTLLVRTDAGLMESISAGEVLIVHSGKGR